MTSEEQQAPEAARAAAPGQFLELSHGLVHYQRAGASTNQAVVLLAGFSVPFFIWDPTYPALVEAGFQVLRYDYYGRGYSDRPNLRYDAALYVGQLLELLDRLGLADPVHLVGLSMGGAVAVGFAARHPERIAKLCLIGPAGMAMPRQWVESLLQLPLVGELLMQTFGRRMLLRSQGIDFHGSPDLAEYLNRYAEQLRYPGFFRALLSTLRSRVLTGAGEDFKAVGRLGLPTQLIWGTYDRTVPFASHRQVMDAIPQAEFVPIQDAAHVPHLEEPQRVNQLMIDFLSRDQERT